MPEHTQPSLYTIPARRPFLKELAQGLLALAGDDPAALPRMTVFLPNRRACRSLREVFLQVTEGQPLLLPRIQPLTEMDEDMLFFGGVAPAMEGQVISRLERRMLLARCVETWLGAAMPKKEVASRHHTVLALRLADELSRLLDEMQREEVDPARLESIVPEELAEHWRQVRDFLNIMVENWPAILKEQQAVEPVAWQLAGLRALAERWRHTPPDGCVVAAGITHALPAARELLSVIARLPNGMVVLPGFDPDMPDDLWNLLSESDGCDGSRRHDPQMETHPAYGMTRFLHCEGWGRSDVKPWPWLSPQDPPQAAARQRLIDLALLPAPLLDHWQHKIVNPAEALSGVQACSFHGLREEASAIAMMMREAVEVPGRTTMLVTPDRVLARYVSRALRRFGIEVDDSAGSPLAGSVPGVFMRLLARAVQERLAPVPLLALLKHPLAAAGETPLACRENARRLEITCLRGIPPEDGIDGLRMALQKARQADCRHQLQWLARVEERLSDFIRMMQGSYVSLTDLLAAHIRAAEALAETDAEPGETRLWAQEAGEALATLLRELSAAAQGWRLHPVEYAAFFDHLLEGEEWRPRYGQHPRLRIYGPLEARLQQADLVIIGGMNEGIWPPGQAHDPWLSRPMRQRLGLPLAERRIGLSAHDFLMLGQAQEVVLTRSARSSGTPTVPSRWWLRLEALLARMEGVPLPYPWPQVHPWPQWVQALDNAGEPVPCEPPLPVPPQDARPLEFSATAIETLLADPYQYYARHILRLRKLDPLGQEPEALHFGNMVHRALELYAHLGDGQEIEPMLTAVFERLEKEDLTQQLLRYPSVRSFWIRRLEKVLRFVAAEDGCRYPSGRQVLAEAKGSMVCDLGEVSATVTARIDRLILAEETICIQDFKTGRPPSKERILSGLASQLAIAALIVESGHIEGLEDVCPEICAMEYWHVSGSGQEPGRVHAVETPRGKVSNQEVIDRARDGLIRLLRHYLCGGRAYPSTPWPGFEPSHSNYEHLARIREWSSWQGVGD